MPLVLEDEPPEKMLMGPDPAADVVSAVASDNEPEVEDVLHPDRMITSPPIAPGAVEHPAMR